MSPVTVNFKVFFQTLFNAKVEWDQLLTGDLLLQWRRSCSAFEDSGALQIPRCYFHDFQTSVTILTAKTRIVPSTKITVSRLELLSALLLSKLMVTARDALISVLILEE